MKKSKNGNGNMFVVRVNHHVTIATFSTILADKCYLSGDEFPLELSRTESRNILYWGLFHHGINGVISDGQLDGSYEEGTAYNKLYDEAKKWVSKNYPYLNETNL